MNDSTKVVLSRPSDIPAALVQVFWILLFAAGTIWLAYIRPRQQAAAIEDPDQIPVAPPIEPMGLD